MAAMDQGKLNSMCSKINSAATQYVSNVSSEVNNMVTSFNTNWVSEASKKLATEIGECLESLATAIKSTFDAKNTDISTAVSNFNAVEEESISYPGFNFGKPSTTLSLNANLPNGKKGVAEGADLSSIETPMTSLISKVDGALDNVNSAVKSSDAFNSAEVNALSSSITKIKSTFDTSMAELKSSLSTRMSGEISTRQSLDKNIVSTLGNS